jgi:hypothetical protein
VYAPLFDIGNVFTTLSDVPPVTGGAGGALTVTVLFMSKS